MSIRTWILLAALGTISSAAAAAPGDEPPSASVFFETKIRPILSAQCYSCHSTQANKKPKGGLLLDSREGLLKGGESGPAIVPGQPEKSRLIDAVRWTSKDLQMPEKVKLSDAVIEDLVTWVKMGAPWPKGVTKGYTGTPAAEYERLRKEHWAWQPLQKAPPGSTIDRLVQLRLDDAGLKAVDPADRSSLLRRVTFDLIGLPPTPEEIRDFVGDPAPKAFEKVVDRLLASRGFGERWGRHWLDVVRFAESTGSARNVAYPHAWRYRDYVIAALNADKPYDQFIREQIAGDLLPSSSPEEKDEHEIATGFLALGVKDLNEKNNEQYLMDAIDDEIDVTSRAFMALTVSCARCHDHKFDPIPTAEYYALAGIFKSTVELSGVKNKGKGAGKDYVAEGALIALGSKSGKTTTGSPAMDEKKGKKGKKAKPESPDSSEEPGGPVAMGVKEGTPADCHICMHGEIEHLGASVPRGVLSIYKPSSAVQVDPKSSGRRELGAWLSSPENPLTPRVLVNRVWSHLFGEGIVPTTDNFGTSGDTPLHPLLLDYLAGRLIDQGWSIKKLIREIVLSETYQRDGEAVPEAMAVDPANHFLWRSSPRRLDAESLRDAMLAVSGQLDPTPPAGSQVARRIGQLGGKKGSGFEPEETRHRSVYLPVVRDEVPDFLHVFDFADPSSINGHRDVTTVATQGLLLMNSRFVTAQAKAFAEILLADRSPDEKERIDAAYRRALGRLPSGVERDRVSRYLAASGGTPLEAWTNFCQVLFESAEFRYLSVPPPVGKENSRVR
jgi:hypothetical protein